MDVVNPLIEDEREREQRERDRELRPVDRPSQQDRDRSRSRSRSRDDDNNDDDDTIVGQDDLNATVGANQTFRQVDADANIAAFNTVMQNLRQMNLYHIFLMALRISPPTARYVEIENIVDSLRTVGPGVMLFQSIGTVINANRRPRNWRRSDQDPDHVQIRRQLIESQYSWFSSEGTGWQMFNSLERRFVSFLLK